MPRKLHPKVRLTDAAVARLALPATGQSIVRDRELSGFGVRLLPSGRRAWIIDVWSTKERRPIRDVIGTFPTTSAVEARKRARKALSEIEGGANPHEIERAAKVAGVTLDEVLAAYLHDGRARLSPKTVVDFNGILRNHLSAWRSRPLVAITPDVVRELHADIGTRSHAAANKVVKLLRLLFNFASKRHGEQLVPANPCHVMKRRLFRSFRRRSVVPAHLLPAFMKAVLELEDRQARLWFMLMACCGFRPGEAARIRIDDIDITARQLKISNTKNGSTFVFPLGAWLLQQVRAYLAELPAGTEYLFTRANKRHGFRYDWTHALDPVEAAVGTAIMATDLRRGFATTAESLDMSGHVVKALLNHSVDLGGVTEGYLAIGPERLRSAVQRIEDELLRLAKINPGAKVVALAARRKGKTAA